MWAGRNSLVNEQTMFKPLNEGGRALVDIKTRNKAIDVMWLKSYLKLGPNRPLWAYVADALMAENVPKTSNNIDDRVKSNPFLQTWKTKSSVQGKICSDITKLFKTAKEFNVRPEGLAFSRDILRDMPIWYHHAANPKLRRLNHGKVAECLKANHVMMKVGDAERITLLLTETGHIELDKCMCLSCMKMENESNCMHPHSCSCRAKEMIDTLPEKWDPRAPQPNDTRPE